MRNDSSIPILASAKLLVAHAETLAGHWTRNEARDDACFLKPREICTIYQVFVVILQVVGSHHFETIVVERRCSTER
jgi:hypothetical protein